MPLEEKVLIKKVRVYSLSAVVPDKGERRGAARGEAEQQEREERDARPHRAHDLALNAVELIHVERRAGGLVVEGLDAADGGILRRKGPGSVRGSHIRRNLRGPASPWFQDARPARTEYWLFIIAPHE